MDKNNQDKDKNPAYVDAENLRQSCGLTKSVNLRKTGLTGNLP
jgi:hypothetical protein